MFNIPLTLLSDSKTKRTQEKDAGKEKNPGEVQESDGPHKAA